MKTLDRPRETIEDKEILGEVNESFERKELVRVFGVNVTFTAVTFKQAVLEKCYFRNCTFIRCDFTGAQLKDCNLRGSSFEGCQFRYATWEKTLLDGEFLDRCLPSEENLARDLVRSLRVNFAQIGNYDAVNKAAAIEVSLTGRHLFNAAYSRQGYYRSLPKYQGIDRLKYAGQHVRWKALDLLWGNGESILRVVISGAVVVALAAAVIANSANVAYADGLSIAFLAFWGLTAMPSPFGIGVVLTVARFVFFGLFMAILVKRLSRR